MNSFNERQGKELVLLTDPTCKMLYIEVPCSRFFVGLFNDPEV